MHAGITADYGGFILKEQFEYSLWESGREVGDFRVYQFDPDNGYPDFNIPLTRAGTAQEFERGAERCGSGVGVSIAVGIAAGLRGKVIGPTLTQEMIGFHLTARYWSATRHWHRLSKLQERESNDTAF
jgi:ribose 5-phosphate isomerase RpiB